MYFVTADNMLKQLIEEEFALCRQAGVKIRFPAMVKKRTLLSTILLPLGIVTLPAAGFGVWLLIPYLFLMLGARNHKYIFKCAKNAPDTDVRQIIMQEMEK